VTCYTQPCKPCEVTYILHYLPQGDESSPRGRWGICAPASPEVLTEIQGVDTEEDDDGHLPGVFPVIADAIEITGVDV
jgi:hypothetical protein